MSESSNEIGEEYEDDLEGEYDEDAVPRIVILGAGPIGLEAALYARYLGYEVAILEKRTVVNNVLRWGHVKMFSPFAMNRSSLGVAALKAQSEDIELPADDAFLTGKEFAEQYLFPLSKSDLLAGCIHENVEVIGVGRDGILKTDVQGIERANFRFRTLVRTPEGDDVVDSDVVIDTTGVIDQPNFVGHGGLPALGELDCREMFCSPLPDVLGSDREHFENKRVLVVGSGYSAATNIVSLAELKKSAPDTQVTWVTRRDSPKGGPIPVTSEDRLARRAELATSANQAGSEHFDQTSVISVSYDGTTGADGQFAVTLGGKLTGERKFDRIIANVGYRPNTQILGELQVTFGSASQATIAMEKWLSTLGSVDALDLDSPGHEVLVNQEPNFYVLGSKSFGRNSNFLLSLGLRQIRDAFAVIAGREDLDLYKTIDLAAL